MQIIVAAIVVLYLLKSHPVAKPGNPGGLLFTPVQFVPPQSIVVGDQRGLFEGGPSSSPPKPSPFIAASNGGGDSITNTYTQSNPNFINFIQMGHDAPPASYLGMRLHGEI